MIKTSETFQGTINSIHVRPDISTTGNNYLKATRSLPSIFPVTLNLENVSGNTVKHIRITATLIERNAAESLYFVYGCLFILKEINDLTSLVLCTTCQGIVEHKKLN